MAVAASSFIHNTIAQQRQLSIMPLGDSITELGCWRAYLWTQLIDAGIKNIQYVGSMTDKPEECGGPNYDKHHEGHAGHQAIDIANRLDYLATWLKPFTPDIVLIHLGTVDIVFNKPQADTLAALEKIVDIFRTKNPNVAFIVAKIIPIPASAAKVTAYNNALPTWANKKNSTASPITLVDQYAGFNPPKELQSDNLHPNDAGDRKMTTVWYPAVLSAIEIRQNRTVA
ncbi:carbohydrate esterase family 3 protein [Amniculicola lignicola CBS 123094]|uniref:Carbohydrate esterase family 3 protein n=1 Tax=Amniculicola lignicola CBS 123094 TaxID=1392246 RepID=A0A6A5VY61_9PLEO|nr:carbohydrate esterase family 3 protein [Amniculicola lignicola CBS 123094]